MEVVSYLLGKKSSGGGDEPTGTIDITSNGVKNVKSYASANVNVQPDLETKSITITENTTTTITPTTGKDGLSSVSVTTNVSSSEKVQTLAQLNEKANELVEHFKSVPSTYTSYTNEPVTLYTPSSDCNIYVIIKRGNGKYRIYWFKNDVGVYLQKVNETVSNVKYWYPAFGQTTNFNLNDYNNEIMLGSYYLSSYQSNEYTTLDQCIQAIQSSSTTYSSSTTMPSTTENVHYTNTFVYSDALDAPVLSQKISSKETIVVKP